VIFLPSREMFQPKSVYLEGEGDLWDYEKISDIAEDLINHLVNYFGEPQSNRWRSRHFFLEDVTEGESYSTLPFSAVSISYDTFTSVNGKYLSELTYDHSRNVVHDYAGVPVVGPYLIEISPNFFVRTRLQGEEYQGEVTERGIDQAIESLLQSPEYLKSNSLGLITSGQDTVLYNIGFGVKELEPFYLGKGTIRVMVHAD